MILVKMEKSNDIKTIICPVCKKTTEVVRIYSIPVDTSPMMLDDDIGEVYQCGHADCMAYLLRVNDAFEPISKFGLLKRQKEITDLLVAESDIARARLYPKAMEAAAMSEMGDVLSTVLYHLTSESPYHPAYTIEEVLDACKTLGFNPSKVDNKRIGFVLGWLQEHKK